MEDITYNKPKPLLTANALKLIAIIAMTLDHFAFSFISNDPPTTMGTLLNIIGMTAAPIMFYFAVEGYHHTRNINKYLLRLAVFAAISQLPFSYFVNGGAIRSILFFNVIYTIFLGVLAIHIRRRLKNPAAKILLILLVTILSAPADWGYWGVILILLFDCFYGDFKKQAIGYCAIVLLILFISRWDIQQAGMLVPIILLYFYNGEKGKGGAVAKWSFYIFYPLHLLVLGFLNSLF